MSMYRVFCLAAFLVVNAIGCHGQDFSTYPTNPPGIPTSSPAPTTTAPPPAPTTAPPPAATTPAPTNASEAAPTSVPTTKTSQTVVDSSKGHDGSTSINANPFILLFCGCTVAVILFVVVRLFRRGNMSNHTKYEPEEPAQPQETVDAAIRQQFQCQRHDSRDSHVSGVSSKTANSSVQSMVYLNAFDSAATPMQQQAQAKVHRNLMRAMSSEQPKSTVHEPSMLVSQEFNVPLNSSVLRVSPVSSSPEQASPERISWASSNAYWSAGDNLCSSFDSRLDDSICSFDDLASTRTSAMTGTMLELVEQEL